MPDGTISKAQVATNDVTPAGEWQNKTPVYISGVLDARGCLSWIQASCQSGLLAQIKGERLMLSESPPTYCNMYLDGIKGVSFHTFALGEWLCTSAY
jgi:hypothetical protein